MRRVLVANRGEIAVRVIRACHALGLEAVAVYAEVDRGSLPTRMADRAVCIGPAPAVRSYLDVPALLAAARGTGADAVHPGYGFLAESPRFARACREAGLAFVGPPPETIELMGDKVRAREMAESLGVPVVPGIPGIATVADARAAAAALGYPLLLKAAAGGGGRGMVAVCEPAGLAEAVARAQAEAHAAFGDGRLYAERLLERVHHVEVQVLGDHAGNLVHLGERDCSVQRRHQKLLEEAPSPAVGPGVRAALAEAAVALARGVRYEGAGTVEFLLEPGRGRFHFIEMNTRIQVEHPVTEMLTGVDLVAEQLRIAAGKPLGVAQPTVRCTGHAIECRINAEAPDEGFRPSPGVLTVWQAPTGPGVRVDTHAEPGAVVPPFYDSLLAKVIVHDTDRPGAVARMAAALEALRVEGVATTAAFHRALLRHPDFVAGRVHTRWLEAGSGESVV